MTWLGVTLCTVWSPLAQW